MAGEVSRSDGGDERDFANDSYTQIKSLSVQIKSLHPSGQTW